MGFLLGISYKCAHGAIIFHFLCHHYFVRKISRARLDIGSIHNKNTLMKSKQPSKYAKLVFDFLFFRYFDLVFKDVSCVYTVNILFAFDVIYKSSATYSKFIYQIW